MFLYIYYWKKRHNSLCNSICYYICNNSSLKNVIINNYVINKIKLYKPVNIILHIALLKTLALRLIINKNVI